jgi:tetratricopeptide (TPR) repeat protein
MRVFFRGEAVPKRNWFFSFLACTGLWSLTMPAFGQALLPYTPELNPEQLEQQGLELTQGAAQLWQFQQYEAALSRAKLATQLAPNLFEAWFILGSLYVQQQDFDQGIQVLKKALSLAPDETKKAGIQFSLGNAFFQKGDYQTAIAELETGLKLRPNTPEALFDLGNANLKLNNRSEAIRSFEKALGQKKDFWPALNNIGLVKYEQGDVKGAIANWQAAIAIDGKQAEPQLAEAVALYQQGQQDKAVRMGEAALKIDVRYADLGFLKENLWGERLLADAKIFLATPSIKAIIDNLQSKPPEPAE